MAPGTEPISSGGTATSASQPSIAGPGAVSLPPYPDRFYSAAAYAGVPEAFESSANGQSDKSRVFSDETKLILYSLYQQATVGPCTTPKPWGWNIAETAKWTSWKQLGNMAPVEAMRLFVRTLEEEDVQWWSRFRGTDERKSEETIIVNEELVVESGSAPAHRQSASTSPLKKITATEVPQSVVEKSLEPSTVANGGGVSPLPLVMEQPPPPPPSDVPSSNGSTPKAREDLPAAEGLEAISVYDQWISPVVIGRRPTPRYQHAAAVLGRKMYITGGNLGGRYLSDIQVLDLETFSWSKIDQKGTTPSPPPSSPAPKNMLPAPSSTLAPCAGHSLIPWKNTLLAIAGHSKEGLESVTVRAFDTETLLWSTLKPSGDLPIARGGQSATLFGANVVMFAGEDPKRRLLNDVHILDLENMSWKAVTCKGTPPAARCDHVAEVHNERYLFVFGGGSHANCYADLHILDLENMEWSRPKCEGPLPSARAGHAGVAIGDCWYIVGGGDNARGISDMLMLNMATKKWSVVASAPSKTSIASEGLSVVAGPEGGDCIIVFGGYNGRYSNEVHVFRPATEEKAKSHLIESSAAETAAANSTDRSLATAGAAEGSLATDGAIGRVDGPMTSSISDGISLVNTSDESSSWMGQTQSSNDGIPFVTAAMALGGKPRPEIDAAPFKAPVQVQSHHEDPQETDTARIETRTESPATTKEEELQKNIEELRKEKDAANAAASSAREELARLKKDLESSCSQLSDSELELQSVRGMLGSEQSRSFRLEVELAELRKKLQQMETLQKEVDLLRRKQEAQEAASAAEKQAAGGVWSWLAGGPTDSVSK